MNLSRRQFMAGLAAGMVVTAEGLWMPGEKLISIPSKKFFVPDGRIAWIEDGVTMMYAGGRGGGKTMIPSYFDVNVLGAQLEKALTPPQREWLSLHGRPMAD
jgi:hypothetical protein